MRLRYRVPLQTPKPPHTPGIKNIRWFGRLEVWLSIASIVVSGILSVVALIQTDRLSKQQQTIKGMNILLRRISDQLSLTSKSNIILQDNLKVLNKELGLQRESHNYLTGGNLVPHLWIIPSAGFINIEVFNDGNYPIRNVRLHLFRLTHDYKKPAGDGTYISDHPDSSKEYSLNLEDLQPRDHKTGIREQYTRTYKHLYYQYTVQWLQGKYVGVFTLQTDESGDTKLLDNKYIFSSKGVDLTRAVEIPMFMKGYQNTKIFDL